MAMRVPVELDPDVDDEAPTGNDITPYDEQHYVIRSPTKRGRGDAGKVTLRAPNGFHAKAIGESWNRRLRPGADRCRRFTRQAA